MPEPDHVRIGAHVGSEDPVGEAQARSGDAAQFFLGDPQGWKAPTVAYPDGAEALRKAAEDADVELYIHAPYVLNVATTNNRIRIPSRKILQQQVDLAAEVGAKGLVIHGGHVLKGDDPDVGVDNWRKCAERLDAKVPVFIENTAGGDYAMARTLDRLARVWDAVAEHGLGFCLDTCHAFAAGIDLAEVVDQIMAITGRIDLVHANDSRDPFGSGADRHANLGDGTIGLAAIAEVVRAAGAPVILETPGAKSGESDDVTRLREYLRS
ncbi:deoxyribonuclease IV [Actinobacteria bacterium YIM 96077]|uniref:Deoxyribonuclease IV n=1 Tax=Phytoactinopolyspora halophila TaxID=1981511 RepID=A0A329QR45_9ACTN|nr:deoxyribonuclease IV [Phytoactinopolyspora halophila]AYY15088.1 deoxyribonuclease IV [Actinobacteria bacterium YIM 96077]RAW14149.1 deoxyribonuclease IV [Phytoactinopolyspora halophila]